MHYLQPDSVDEAIQAMAARRLVVLAGGTDHFPTRVGRLLDEDIIDISRLGSLRGIVESDAGWSIGALTTWTELIAAPLPPLFDGLKLAAREVGAAQVQNRGTIGGNLCNASPAADGMPPLLCANAQVELQCAAGTRQLKLDEFVVGNRKTARRPDELMTRILVPRPRRAARSGFVKLGARKYLVISIVMVAGALELTTDNRVEQARVAVGSCAARAMRLRAFERSLVGMPLSELGDRARTASQAELSPIDDIRGSAAYRRDATGTLLSDLFERLAS